MVRPPRSTSIAWLPPAGWLAAKSSDWDCESGALAASAVESWLCWVYLQGGETTNQRHHLNGGRRRNAQANGGVLGRGERQNKPKAVIECTPRPSRGLSRPPAPSRAAQHSAIGIATERSAATRGEDRLSLSRVGQRLAIGIATERTAATRGEDPHTATRGTGTRSGSCAETTAGPAPFTGRVGQLHAIGNGYGCRLTTRPKVFCSRAGWVSCSLLETATEAV